MACNDACGKTENNTSDPAKPVAQGSAVDAHRALRFQTLRHFVQFDVLTILDCANDEVRTFVKARVAPPPNVPMPLRPKPSTPATANPRQAPLPSSTSIEMNVEPAASRDRHFTFDSSILGRALNRGPLLLFSPSLARRAYASNGWPSRRSQQKESNRDTPTHRAQRPPAPAHRTLLP